MQPRDTNIVKAAIYPAIGIARVGNSSDEYYIGPEVPWPEDKPASFYKDASGALKRQAAKFRIYGLNCAGEVVKELTDDDAGITWTVHVANKKAAWYQFDQALDIATTRPAARRNAKFQGDSRDQLAIDPGALSISGANQGGDDYRFDGGRFLGETVYLGELKTDAKGRLLFLGGHGISNTPIAKNPVTTFANNDGWHDDTSDGPVTAKVILGSQELEVDPAWVVTGPPNYSPSQIGVMTMWDVMVDAYHGAFWPTKLTPSFTHDIYPLLRQFSDTQWVNFGFYVGFGYHQAYDFTDRDYVAKLASKALKAPKAPKALDEYREYRRQVFNNFRPPDPTTIDAEAWPWMYGDQVNISEPTPQAYLSITKTLYGYLQAWVAGDFIDDWDPDNRRPGSLDDIDDPQLQADALNKASLWFCLGGPFHPGCEMTWPMRHTTMYSSAFRIRHRLRNDPEPDYGDELTYDTVMGANGPLHAQGPGDISRWMAVPWQTDSASCRAGYDKKYDPWLPTFWAARVPNHVLTEQDYEVVVDESQPRADRLKAFNRRALWFRILGEGYLNAIRNMVDLYGDLGVVGYRPGIKDDADFPPAMYVESPPGSCPRTMTPVSPTGSDCWPRWVATRQPTSRATGGCMSAKSPRWFGSADAGVAPVYSITVSCKQDNDSKMSSGRFSLEQNPAAPPLREKSCGGMTITPGQDSGGATSRRDRGRVTRADSFEREHCPDSLYLVGGHAGSQRSGPQSNSA